MVGHEAVIQEIVDWVLASDFTQRAIVPCANQDFARRLATQLCEALGNRLYMADVKRDPPLRVSIHGHGVIVFMPIIPKYLQGQQYDHAFTPQGDIVKISLTTRLEFENVLQSRMKAGASIVSLRSIDSMWEETTSDTGPVARFVGPMGAGVVGEVEPLNDPIQINGLVFPFQWKVSKSGYAVASGVAVNFDHAKVFVNTIAAPLIVRIERGA